MLGKFHGRLSTVKVYAGKMTQGSDDDPGSGAAEKSVLSRMGGKLAPLESDKPKTEQAGLIVGIGASAGGLAAFTSFLATMPANSGMAFILVQHLAPDHKSILSDLLGKATRMPVLEAEDGMPMGANHVFVIPLYHADH
jgi:chemotaxis response regulator CheB